MLRLRMREWKIVSREAFFLFLTFRRNFLLNNFKKTSFSENTKFNYFEFTGKFPVETFEKFTIITKINRKNFPGIFPGNKIPKKLKKYYGKIKKCE